MPNDGLEHARAIENLQNSLGYLFRDPDLLITALRHRSYVHQFKDAGEGQEISEDNQRLEFLGDAVLGLCVSTMLYHRFPLTKEGLLSRMRAGLVNEVRLAKISRLVGVDTALLLGRGEETTGGRSKNSILADALEAVVAAIFLDGGYGAACQVVETLWRDLVERSSEADLLKDYKTQVQEKYQQAIGRTPTYQLTASEGPDHARTFQVALMLDGQVVSTGRGRSKKEAEQAAAQAALNALNTPSDTDSGTGGTPEPPASQIS